MKTPALALVLSVGALSCSSSGEPTLDPTVTTTTVADVEEDDPTDDIETGDSEDLEDDPTDENAGSDDPDTVDADEGEDGDGLEDPDVDVLPSSEEVDAMIEEANADGVVTETEMAEILTESGTPQAQASCEGAVLAELGVTDPTDLDQLRTVAEELTEEQRIELSNCIAGG